MRAPYFICLWPLPPAHRGGAVTCAGQGETCSKELGELAGLAAVISHWKAYRVVEGKTFFVISFSEWQKGGINIYTGENKQNDARWLF